MINVGSPTSWAEPTEPTQLVVAVGSGGGEKTRGALLPPCIVGGVLELHQEVFAGPGMIPKVTCPQHLLVAP